MTPDAAPSVLILEDEPIIALDMVALLTDAGMNVLATLPTCTCAMNWLKTNRADVALFDIRLQDGSCELVAQRLNDLAIPFVVFSGSSRTEEAIDPVFLTGGWLGKPAPAARIVTAVKGALRGEFEA